jgi:hypothetical protein
MKNLDKLKNISRLLDKYNLAQSIKLTLFSLKKIMKKFFLKPPRPNLDSLLLSYAC